MKRSIGHLLLGIYLILIGLNAMVRLGLPGEVTAILALLAGIFLLLGK